MKKKVMSGLLVTLLVISLVIPVTAATEGFIESPNNGSQGNNGTEIIGGNEETEEPAVTPEENKKPDTVPSDNKEAGENTAPDAEAPNGPKEPALVTADGERQPLQVVVSEEQDSNTTQEERAEILKDAEGTIMVTQSAALDGMLGRFTENETTEETTSEEAIAMLVENGVSVEDALETVAVSKEVEKSESVSEVLDNFSDDLKVQVQEEAKEDAKDLQEKTEVRNRATKKALGIIEEQTSSETEAVNVEAVKEVMAAEDEEEAVAYGKVQDQLEEKNVVITSQAIGQVVQNQEEHQEKLEKIQEGDIDQMSVHSVFDISASGDVKQQVNEEGSHVEVSVSMPGIDEDTLVVGVKAYQKTDTNIDAEENYQDLKNDVDEGNGRTVLEKLGSDMKVIPCTAFDGGVTMEVSDFSPVIILVLADNTTDIYPLEEETMEPAAAVPEEVEEPADGVNWLVILGIAAAVIFVGGAVYYRKKSEEKD